MLKLNVGGTATVKNPEGVALVDSCDDKCKLNVSPELIGKMKAEAEEIFARNTNETEGQIESIIEAGKMLDDAPVPTEGRMMPDVSEFDYNQAIEAGFKTPAIERDLWPDQSNKDPKVTLAMIVRNEEAHVAECLSSMKDHVDEIVVVDTGSTDRTIEICKSFGAKVYEHPWEDSFSIARNHAISHVNTPWLIQLDADEIMEEKYAKQVRDTVRSAHPSTCNLVHLTLKNQDKEGKEPISIVSTGKIMRVIPLLHFVNRVHNRLVCPGDTRLTNLEIIHHGYSLPDKETMKNKKDRTTRLLLLQVEEQPTDAETHHYLGIQYLRMEDYETALEYAKKATELFEEHEPHSQLRLLSLHIMSVANYHLASKAGKREQQQPLFDKAIKYAKQALELYPDYLDSNCILSGVYFALKDHEQCLKYATKYLAACEMLKKDKSKALVIPLLTLSQEWQVCLQLAINFFEQADADKAIALIARGEALLPKELKYKLTWGVFKYMIMLGDPISLKNAESIYMVGFKSE